ncbi:MAG TPA: cohesin domain-containing protein [Candidatus Saccharimonadales bacterium]|nr:cohesin domain-containing protein [Candidatus Saccharimonadales bacterium]
MKTKIFTVLLVLVVELVAGLYPGHAHAGSGVVYISPSGASVQSGNAITVQLRISPGTAVNAVQATVGYDSSTLQYDSSSIGAFSTCTVDTGTSFACAMLGSSTSSDSLIASITFTALAGSGSTSLSVSGQNAAYNGSYTDPGASGATISFTSPPQQSGGGGGGSSGGSSSTSHSSSRSSTSSSSTSSTTTPSTPVPTPATPVIPPKLVTSDLTDVQFQAASIKFSANVPVEGYIIFGTSKNDLNLITTPTGFGKSGSVSFGQGLTPGTTYYYKMVVKDDSGNYVESSLKSLTTKGYTVVVTVLDSKYKPLVGQVVTLHSTPMSATTNSQGVATFTDVAPGLHHVDYSASGHTYSQPTYVLNNVATAKDGVQSAPTQTNAIVLSGYVQPKHSSWGTYLFITLLVVILLVAWRFIMLILSNNRRNFEHYASAFLPHHGKSHA